VRGSIVSKRSAAWVIVIAALAALVIIALTDTKERRGRRGHGFDRPPETADETL